MITSPISENTLIPLLSTTTSSNGSFTSKSAFSVIMQSVN